MYVGMISHNVPSYNYFDNRFCRYARKHFPPANVEGTMTKEIQRAMALLAFKPDTSCSPYRVGQNISCHWIPFLL